MSETPPVYVCDPACSCGCHDTFGQPARFERSAEILTLSRAVVFMSAKPLDWLPVDADALLALRAALGDES